MACVTCSFFTLLILYQNEDSPVKDVNGYAYYLARASHKDWRPLHAVSVS